MKKDYCASNKKQELEARFLPLLKYPLPKRWGLWTQRNPFHVEHFLRSAACVVLVSTLGAVQSLCPSLGGSLDISERFLWLLFSFLFLLNKSLISISSPS